MGRLCRARARATLARLCVADIADWAEIYAFDDTGVVWRRKVAHCDASKASLVQQLESAALARDGGHPVLQVIATRRPVLVSMADEPLLNSMTPDPRHRGTVRSLGRSTTPFSMSRRSWRTARSSIFSLSCRTT